MASLSFPIQAAEGAELTTGGGAEPLDGRKERVTAAAWLASQHAVDMERASEKQLSAGIDATLDAFPAVKLPRRFQVWTGGACPPFLFLPLVQDFTSLSLLALLSAVHRLHASLWTL